MKLLQKAIFFSLVAYMTSISVLALADNWPTAHHDYNRTSRSLGTGEISNPSIFWSYYLGGIHERGKTWFGDANGDSILDVLAISEGRLKLFNSGLSVEWISDYFAAKEIAGAWDFDKDGTMDILVTRSDAPAGLYILSGKTGQILWKKNNFDVAATYLPIYFLTVVDLNADGYMDIVAKPNNNYPKTHAFSFKDGYKTNPDDNEMWNYTHEVYSNKTPYVIGDVDNDQKMEVVFVEQHKLTILNGETGILENGHENVFKSHVFGLLQIANVDSDDQNEIIAIGAELFNYTIAVYDAFSKSLEWKLEFTDKLKVVENSVIDLNNDNKPEIIVSVYDDTDDEADKTGTAGNHDTVNEADKWTLLVFNAADGSLLAHKTNAYLHGIDVLHTGEAPYIIIQQVIEGSPTVPSFGTIETLKLDNNTLNSVWTKSDAAPAIKYSPNTPTENPMGKNIGLVVNDKAELTNKYLFLQVDSDQDGFADTLGSYFYTPTTRAGLELFAEYIIPENEEVNVLKVGEIFSTPFGKDLLVLFRNSGTVDYLISTPQKKYEKLANYSQMTGDYYSNALASKLKNDGDVKVIVDSSNNSIQVLDIANADYQTSPTVEWFKNGKTKPLLTLIDIDADGEQEIPFIDMTNPVNPKLQLFGSVTWTKEFTGYGSTPIMINFGNFDNDAFLDVLVIIKNESESDSTKKYRLITLDGETGAEMLNQPIALNNTPWEISHTIEMNGDDYDDIILVQTEGVDYYDGSNGNLIAQTEHSSYANNSVLADFDNDSTSELLLFHNVSDYGIRLWELKSTTPAWTIKHSFKGETDQIHTAIFERSGGGFGFFKGTNQGYINALDHEGNDIWTNPLYVKDGTVSTTDPTENYASLSDLTVADINGDSNEDLIFGTSDNYLMALNTADGSLIWAFDLGSRVYQPVVADVDDDSKLEILVSTATGYLHLIDEASIDAPAEVRDVKLSSTHQLMNPGTDIDETEHIVALGAAWDAVTDATDYMYTVEDDHGNEMFKWISTKNNTEIVIPVKLLHNRTYKVKVRSIASSGQTSTITKSDGVLTKDASDPLITDLKARPGFNPKTQKEIKIEATLTDVTELASYTLEIADKSRAIHRTYSGNLFGQSYKFVKYWDGKNESDAYVADGIYSAKLTVKDVGNHEVSETIDILVDTVVPQIPTITSPKDNDVLYDRQPTFAGTGEAGTIIRIQSTNVISDLDICTAQLAKDGSFSCKPDFNLPFGFHEINVFVIDTAANFAQVSSVLTIKIAAQVIDGDSETEIEEELELEEELETTEIAPEEEKEITETTPTVDGDTDDEITSEEDTSETSETVDTSEGSTTPEEEDEGGSGGCSSSQNHSAWLFLTFFMFIVRKFDFKGIIS